MRSREDPVLALARSFRISAKRVAAAEAAIKQAVSSLPTEHIARGSPSVTVAMTTAEPDDSPAFALVNCFSVSEIRRALDASDRGSEIGDKVARFTKLEAEHRVARGAAGLDDVDAALATAMAACSSVRRRLLATRARTPAGILAKLKLLSLVPDHNELLRSIRRDLIVLSRSTKRA